MGKSIARKAVVKGGVKKSATDRGKLAEKDVTEFLEGWSARHATFDWQRMPDARAAMGRIKKQIGDFEIFEPDSHGVVEVKETENESRLRRDHIPQLNKLRVRALAGGEILVLVYHSTLAKWRLPPFHYLADTEGASWDISAYPLYDSVAEVLSAEAGFIE